MVITEDNLAAEPPDGRSQVRSSMFLAAVMGAGAEQAPVRIRNMSPTGAMMESPITPVPGTQIDLIRWIDRPRQGGLELCKQVRRALLLRGFRKGLARSTR